MAQFDNLGVERFSKLNVLRNSTGHLTMSTFNLVDDAYLHGTNGRLALGVGAAGTRKLQVRDSGGNQLRLEYDATNYVDFDVDVAGNLTISPTGQLLLGNTDVVGSLTANTLSVEEDATFNTSRGGFDLIFHGDTSDNVLFGDASTNRLGVGTATPGAKLDVLATTAQIRASYDGSNYGETFTLSDGRTAWTNSMGSLQWFQMGSTNANQGLVFLVDETANQCWIRPNTDAAGHSLDLYFNVRTGRSFVFNVQFGAIMTVSNTSVSTERKLDMRVTDASTDTVLSSFLVNRFTSGTAAAGIGAKMEMRIEESDTTAPTQLEMHGVLDVATSGSVDSSFRFSPKDNDTIKELVRMDGGTMGVLVSDNATQVPDAMLHLIGSSAMARELLHLEQLDVDAPFTEYEGTTGADTTSSISTLTTSGATTHHIQIEINGTKAWIAASTNNPS